MKKSFIIIILFSALLGYAGNETSKVYKKRVLENIEIDLLTSFYSQDGDNASVTGGIGTEKLINFTPTIVISIPLNADDVLTIDAGISAYTSASSGNLNPFNPTGASSGDSKSIIGSPWVASSGASESDKLVSGNISYSHSSDSRNSIWSLNVSRTSEYDYSSLGFGGSLTKLFNEKNTEISIKANIFLDQWDPKYPTEITTYLNAGQDLNKDFFSGVDIYNKYGNVINKNGTIVWKPYRTTLLDNTQRKTYSLSFSFSQILSKKAQFSFFFDVIQQVGWLANPMHRVYFSDIDNYYIGNPSNINNYRSPENTDVFQLADDIERLPDVRFKVPIGFRFHYYLNEVFVLRAYYRYYFDDWGISSHTADIEIPIKISDKFTLYPSYRYYYQTAADYFEPFDRHLSTQSYYTSDYDLSEFLSNQISLGISYTDIFTSFHIGRLRLKKIDLKYSYYKRCRGITANIIAVGFKFIID